MDKRFGKLKILCAVLLLVMSLAACGEKDNAPGYVVGSSTASSESGNEKSSGGEIKILEEKGEEFFYFTEEVALNLDGYPSVKVFNDCLYYGVEHSLMCYSFADKSVTTQELKWTDAPEEWNFRSPEFGIDGSIYGIVTSREKAGTSTYVCKFDSEGVLVYAHDLTEELRKSDRSSWSSNWRVDVDEDGLFYLADNDLLWIISEDGAKKDTITVEGTSAFVVHDMARTTDNCLHVTYKGGSADTYYIGELTPNFVGKGSEDAASYQQKVAVTGMETLGENQLLVYDANAVYRYDLSALTFEQMFTWEQAGVEGSKLVYVGSLYDGRIAAVTFGVNAQVMLVDALTKSQAEEKGYQFEKEDIVIGLLYNEITMRDLKNAVAYFNRKSDKYNVILEDYWESAADFDAARNRLNSELVAGKGPDLLGFGNFEDFARNNAVENLYDYLDKSESMSKEDFFANLLAEYDVNGVLTAIPREFQLSTIIGSSKVVGEEMGWTLDEMIALGEQYPDKVLFYEDMMSKRSILIYFIRFYGEQFLDWEKGTCNFDTEEFRKLLKFMERFPDKYTLPGENDPTIYTRLASGEVLTTKVLVTDFRRIQHYQEALGGDITYIGYPTPEGAGCWLSDYDALAINANSKCKEGAWEFIEFLVQYYVEGASGGAGLPSYIPLYEKRLHTSMTDSRSAVGYLDDNWTFKMHTTTQEEADKIRALVENGQYTTLDVDMVNIIIEEADSYFSGQKDMDTVIEIIQNRVQNYMEEQE